MTTNTTKRALIHHGVDESKANEATRTARWNDLRTSNWLSTTQVWSWDDGDAIVVITGYLPSVHSYVVIRIGQEVNFVEGVGLKSAMSAFGLDLADFYITTEQEAA
jgi:hypothetical protein